MRKLASIQEIRAIEPIEGADRIEVATINDWKVVVAKDVGHKVGDKVVYCEIDSFLPIQPEFEFLRKSSYKKMESQEGFRLKTIRLRGQYSQGLILPLSGAQDVSNRLGNDTDLSKLDIDTEVTELLGIVKYEPPIPANLGGKVKGNFPSFLRKTDEERVQNLTKEYQSYKEREGKWYVAEKLDGSSATFYLRDNEFGVCSRNLDLARPEPFEPGKMVMCNDGVERPVQENSFWKVARELDLENKLKSLNRNLSLQGELIGEGVQKNPYKIKGHRVRFFNVFDIDKYEYLPLDEFTALIKELGLETVPILDEEFELPETIDELIKKADGKSLLNNKATREGFVVRSHDRKISFKAISNKFLLKEKD